MPHERRKIGDVFIDTNGVTVKAVPEVDNNRCSGCFYQGPSSLDCQAIRDEQGNTGCTRGGFIFVEVKEGLESTVDKALQEAIEAIKKVQDVVAKLREISGVLK
ncbi:MAG: hypothetical protein EHM36_12095 [Deltaproteobacteria bacterium]|nr:MAG: hypothetical protein EHM36_12095 [Deltaproteobacteria bacterium]